MLRLEPDHVRLGQTAPGKEAAIRLVGRVMIDAGFIEPGYVDSMLAREKVASTFLGNGIAIPHGLPAARHLVKATGVVVVQFPAGIPWGDGHQMRVAVGIAASSDEHLGVLAKLTGLIGDEATADHLAVTQDVDELLAAVNGKAAAPPPPGWTSAASIHVESPRPHGLHARPATALVTLTKRFHAEIAVRHAGRVANGKSLIALLALGAAGGTGLDVFARGDDEAEALAAIGALFADRLGEAPEDAPALTGPGSDVDYDGRVLAGIAASPGIVTGPVWTFQREKIVVRDRAADPAVQHHRLDQALAGAAAELRRVHDEFTRKAGAARAAIFAAHLELLDDPELVAGAHAAIADGASAGFAWRAAYEERADELAGVEDAALAMRAADLRDVGRRVLHMLADAIEQAASLPDHPVVLTAEDLAPSDTARLDPKQVLGICTASGGPTSHTAIIARSLDIPAVVAAGPAVLDLDDGEPCILDGHAGVLVARPTGADLARAAARRGQALERSEADRESRFQPAVTRDGRRIEVVANIGAPTEAAAAIEAGAEGVGLVRTEFLFLGRDTPPTEDEQAAAYGAMVRAMNGQPIILRTLDIGGDKAVPYLHLPAERNPFLGVRGIRLCLEREDLFRTQLRAIFRASRDGAVRIMYPMVSSGDELARAKAITEDVRRQVDADPVDIGIMIEVPSAVMLAEQLARECAFFSIGTNDLTQYVLAMDRQHPVLAAQADGLHPAVLRMIERTVAGAREGGIWVGACGGIAGDPLGSLILAGLGIAELSVSIPSVAATKALLRRARMDDAEALARRALACRSAAEVRALVPGGPP